MKKTNKSDYLIQSVSYALDILEQFHGSDDELGVNLIRKKINISKNYSNRLLTTLASREYIELNKSTGNYRLGIKELQLGQMAVNQKNFQGKTIKNIK